MIWYKLRKIMDYSAVSLQRALKEIQKMPVTTKEERRKVRTETFLAYVSNTITCFMFFWIAIASICILLAIFQRTKVVLSTVVVICIIVAESFDFRSKPDAGKLWAEKSELLNFVVLPASEKVFEMKLDPEVFTYTGQAWFKEDGFYFSLPKTIRDYTQALRLQRVIERRLADQTGVDEADIIRSGRVFVNGSIIFIRR